MSFFDELSKKITQTSQTAVQKTRNFADITKLNSMISDETHHQEELFIQIGKAYYEQHVNTSGCEYEEILNSITKSKENIDRYQLQIKQIKGITNCPACGAEVPFSSAFCNACGERITHDAVQLDSKMANMRRCAVCGAAVSDGQKFCVSCGNIIVERDNSVDQQAELGTCQIAQEDSTPVEQVIESDDFPNEALKCPNCGEKINDDDVFCVNCGAKLK